MAVNEEVIAKEIESISKTVIEVSEEQKTLCALGFVMDNGESVLNYPSDGSMSGYINYQKDMIDRKMDELNGYVNAGEGILEGYRVWFEEILEALGFNAYILVEDFEELRDQRIEKLENMSYLPEIHRMNGSGVACVRNIENGEEGYTASCEGCGFKDHDGQFIKIVLDSLR